MNKRLNSLCLVLLVSVGIQAQTFRLNNDGYFNAGGSDVMAFSDFYPEGHQGGVCIIINGQRIATNGDIRLEATPGQWQPVPKQLSHDVQQGRIVTTLCYPDSSRHLTGFNPMVYPDWNVNYTVTVEPQGKGILVTVDLDKPVPDFLIGKAGFNLEFFPGLLFGKPWIMDSQTGIYPQQPNAPLLTLPTNRGHDGNFFAGRGQQADLSQLDGEGYSPLRADDIIANSLRQYALLGDAAAMTDGIAGNSDDRWIFTEDNPQRALSTAAQLAAAARVLRGFNDALSKECQDIASDIYQQHEGDKLHAAVELYLTTGEQAYLDYIISQKDYIVKNIGRTGWYTARIAKLLEEQKGKQSRQFVAAYRQALAAHRTALDKQAAETPYGVPYRPSIWGAGWDIQRFGFEYYFLASAYPQIFPAGTIFHALDFVLGCHPGSNTASFASGVGAKSSTVAYGLNRADWSYIPGGVVSGLATRALARY